MTTNRNVKTFVPFLASDFIDTEEPILSFEDYSKFVAQHEEHLGHLNKVLVAKLHDSWVLDFRIEENQVTLDLNDFKTHVFSDAIVAKFKLDIDHDKLVFPVSLKFQGILKAEFYTVKHNGELVNIDPIQVDEYLCEELISADSDTVELVIQFWHNSQNKNKPGKRILLYIKAEKIMYYERQNEAWEEIFGDVYAGYYHYFKEQYQSGRFVSSFGECLKLVDEYDEKSK